MGAIMTKSEALAAAKRDYARGHLDQTTHVYEAWGGTTGYVAMRDGIYRVMRHDSGSTTGLRRHTLRVVNADRLAEAAHG